MAARSPEPCDESVPDESVPEELVAYLDGELEPDAAERVERRLAEDADYRKQLQGLQRAWDLLDFLPRGTVDPEFTSTTLQMVAVAAAADQATSRTKMARRRGAFAWIAALILCAAAGTGYYVTRLVLGAPNRNLVRDLALLESLDAYRHAESIEFLRELHRRGHFSGDTEDGTTTAPLDEAAESRRQRLAEMSAIEKDELQRGANRFHSLPTQEQTRLRRLHDELAHQEDGSSLRLVMIRYADWLQTLPSGQRLELLELPEEKRFQEMTRLIEVQALTASDATALLRWLDRFVQAHRDEILAAFPPKQRSLLEQLPARDMKRVYLNRTSEQVKPSPADLEELGKQLSVRPRELLRQQEDTEARLILVWNWARAAMNDPTRRPFAARLTGPDRAELERFLSSLSPDERERLERLPRMQAVMQLRRLHAQRKDDVPAAAPTIRTDRPVRDRSIRPGSRTPGQKDAPEPSD